MKVSALKILDEAGLKHTRRSVEIIDVLTEAEKPMSAEEIYDKTDDISLSTVYRALERFERAGVVKHEIFDGSERLWELAANRHRHYAICLSCKQMQYIDSCPVADTKVKNFTVTGHRLELYGYCDECMKKKHPEK